MMIIRRRVKIAMTSPVVGFILRGLRKRFAFVLPSLPSSPLFALLFLPLIRRPLGLASFAVIGSPFAMREVAVVYRIDICVVSSYVYFVQL